VRTLVAIVALSLGCSTAGLGVDDDDAVETPCRGASRLVGDACVAADSLAVYASRSQLLIADQRRIMVGACFSAAGSERPPVEPTASDGPCSVEVYSGLGAVAGPGFPQRDAGRIFIRGATPALITLSPASGCYRHDAPPGGISFSAGDILEASGEGGADYPAFSARVAVPAEVVIESDAMAPGKPLPLRWRGGDPRRSIAITVHANDANTWAYLHCEVPDSGSYTVPASLMQYFPATAVRSDVNMTRRRTAHLEPDGIDAVINLTVVNEGARTLRYGM
jgi:hypothetical protein